MLIFLLVVLMLINVGCVTVVNEESNSRNERSISEKETERFVLISKQKIDDNSINGITINLLVDKETKVMYVFTTKYQHGYGAGMEVLVDENGKPVIYEGEL